MPPFAQLAAADCLLRTARADSCVSPTAQLAQQMVASMYFVPRHHDLAELGPEDIIRELKQEEAHKEGTTETHRRAVFARRRGGGWAT